MPYYPNAFLKVRIRALIPAFRQMIPPNASKYIIPDYLHTDVLHAHFNMRGLYFRDVLSLLSAV